LELSTKVGDGAGKSERNYRGATDASTSNPPGDMPFFGNHIIKLIQPGNGEQAMRPGAMRCRLSC
jgi:hypothetical protein